MDIKERLVKIISSEGLTSSAFADYIGVQRSSISHILSGRNKPSLDFLQKIIRSFPKYNADWLITGDGDVYKAPKQTNIYDNLPEQLSQVPLKEEVSDKIEDLSTKSESIKKPIINHEQTESSIKPPVNTEEKIIEKIVIFYTDNTFKAYTPN